MLEWCGWLITNPPLIREVQLQVPPVEAPCPPPMPPPVEPPPPPPER